VELAKIDIRELPIKDNRAFGLLVFNNPDVYRFDGTLSREFYELKFVNSVILDAMSIKYLGQDLAGRLERSRSLIFILSKPPHATDSKMLKALQHLLKSITIVLDFGYENCYQLIGKKSRGEITIQQIDYCERRYNHKDCKVSITNSDLTNIYKIFCLPDDIPKTRLTRGISCLYQSSENQYLDDQLHQYVRAIEALTLSFGREQFSKRCSRFVANKSPTVKALLRNMYWFRNNVEHLNYSCSTPGMFYSLLSRLLAAKIYTRILTNYHLAKQHFDDANLELLWQQSENKDETVIPKYVTEPIEIDPIINYCLSKYPRAVNRNKVPILD
jgi:hypothetical protein